MFVDATKDAEANQAAIMISPLISSPNKFCFNMFFQIKVCEICSK